MFGIQRLTLSGVSAVSSGCDDSLSHRECIGKKSQTQSNFPSENRDSVTEKSFGNIGIATRYTPVTNETPGFD